MTFEEMERAMREVKDNLVVQGQILDRLDRDMSESRRDFDERVRALLAIAQNHEGRLQVLQSAMQSLFEHMDRFIRGLESNGHHPENEGT